MTHLGNMEEQSLKCLAGVKKLCKKPSLNRTPSRRSHHRYSCCSIGVVAYNGYMEAAKKKTIYSRE